MKKNINSKNRLLFWAKVTIIFWLGFVLVPSIQEVRDLIALPLIISDPTATGETAYVMAGGTNHFQRRLLGAIDLYKRKRISHIIFMRNDAAFFDYHSIDPYWTQTNWAVEILKLYDVPKKDITILEPAGSDFLGTLREAQNYKQAIAKKYRHLVVVTSAAHTRRSLLAFRRTLDENIKITPYAVTPFKISTERFRPIWLEYVKLAVYLIVA